MGGGVNLISSTPADASGKEVTSADYVTGQITQTKDLIPTNSIISGMGMPSSKYVNLTLGASGTTYTAPANGWVKMSVTLSASTYMAFFNGNTVDAAQLLDNKVAAIAQNYVSFFPVTKGQVVRAQYVGTPLVHSFIFIYAVGDQ